MSEFGLGITGTGMIAGTMAKAAGLAQGVRLAAVSSRRLERAHEFAAEHGTQGVEGVDGLLARDDVEGVYVAVPTAAKEAIALAAIENGRHVLVDKPFMSEASVRRMVEAAESAGVAFMDATHFSHHPRTAALKAAIPERIGTPRTLHSAFYCPALPADNIRFDKSLEPTGALGDMAWYSMRAVVEFLQPTGSIARLAAVAERDPGSDAVVRVSGLIAFESGECTTFDAGYTADTVIMDLALHGTQGIATMDDFVLDWRNSLAFEDERSPTGIVYRRGLATRSAFEFFATPAARPQAALMLEGFATLASEKDAASRVSPGHTSIATQRLLDALWREVSAQ